MDRGKAAEEVHTVFRGNEGSKRDYLRTRLLLDMYYRLDQGEAGVSALQARDYGAARFAAEGIGGILTDDISSGGWNPLYMKVG